MVVSARDRFSSANRPAVWTKSVWWASAAFSAILFHVVQMGPGQKFAATVWSAVRLVLVFCPRLLTSLRAWAYAAVPRPGGGAGRNWSAACSTKGVTVGHCVNTAGANLGGVGSKPPGREPAGNDGVR